MQFEKEKQAEASALAYLSHISLWSFSGIIFTFLPCFFLREISCTYITFPRELDDFNAIMNNWRLAEGKRLLPRCLVFLILELLLFPFRCFFQSCLVPLHRGPIKYPLLYLSVFEIPED
ncbi:hypothetical protein V2G26_000893 [Clonostachys chloroleuca]